MRKLYLITEEEFKKLNLKGPIPLENNSELFFNNGDAFIVHQAWYHDVGKHYYNIIQLNGSPNAKDICDLCVGKGLPLRTSGRYCALDMGLGKLEGKYRVATVDDDDHNFKCTYLTPREGHTKIFK